MLVTTPSKAVDAPLELQPEIVDQILEIYLPEHRYIVNATMRGQLLACLLRPTVYPYTRRQVFDYVTAPTATLFACQLAYVLIGGMVLTGHPVVNSITSFEEFLAMREHALLRFASIDFRFRSEVENSWPIEASISAKRAKVLASNIHSNMTFNIGGGITGEVHGVILAS